MLDTAEVLSLSETSVHKVADAVAQASHSIKDLQQLCIEATGADSAGCLPWLLTQAINLDVLVASVSIKQWFPPVANLKHIVLEFPLNDSGNLCGALCSAAALQTLCLGNSKSKSAGKAVFPLILDKLQLLKVLALKGFHPERLVIPKKCRMHLSGIGNFNLVTQKEWRGCLTNLHSVGGYLMMQNGCSAMEHLLSKQLRPARNVIAMHIQCYSEVHYEGCAQKDMLKGIEHLKKVAFTGGNVVFYLPANVRWHVVTFEASNLILHFEDVNKFVKAVPKFGATFKSMRNTWMADLCAVLAARGISWATQEDARGSHKFWYPAGEYPGGCWCGACLECLVALGNAAATPVEPVGQDPYGYDYHADPYPYDGQEVGHFGSEEEHEEDYDDGEEVPPGYYHDEDEDEG